MTESIASARDSRVVDVAELGLEAEIGRIVEALDKSRAASVGNLWGASQALVLTALTKRAQGPWVAVTSSEAEAQGFVDDLAAFGAEAVWLPARESYSAGRAHADLDAVRRRLQVLQRIAGPANKRPRLIVASLLSLLQPMSSPQELEKNWFTLQAGQTLDTEALLERLVTAGYSRLPLAEKPGEVSLRGEILDIYPLASELPLRIELFGDEIESLRTFDPVDQRSVESLKEVQISLAADAGGVEDGEGVLPTSVLASTTVYVRVEPMRIDDRAEGLRIQSPSHARALLQFAASMDSNRRLDLMSLPGTTLNFDTRSVQSFGVGVRESPHVLRETTADGTRVVLLCQNEAEEHRFRTVLAEAGVVEGVEIAVGAVSKGFRLPQAHLVVVNHREIVGILGKRAVAKVQSPHRVRALQSFFELKLGDIVVHSVHGVARFAGLKRMERGGGEEEHLHLQFADEVSLYVPAARIDLVQRYIGTGSATPPLDKIGSTSFRRRKEKVERALFDLATELLEVQARRSLKSRAPWDVDPALMKDMIGAFPWTETADQLEVDREIDHDLASPRPMDRLLCGDVGFGKTELAIRAAFRVVSGGGQVAVLVPTTVLAQQHHDVFRERLADFPVNVVALSRYVNGKAEREAVEGVEKGEVDIVIGTHRILSSDLKFKNLGLVIVDEEQRFGVTHKEHFKKLRANIDLLTLSATPIPRTLHMSMSGLRDISALTIPPPGRQEIETILGYTEDEALLREALLREKNRGGQVFFLHNRVHSIRQTALKLQQLVPECSYAIGHGQMTSNELKGVMSSFTHGEVDVLVATTIIESGLDIPAAGTIVIDHADEFGLSELHQLRGRVGRGTNKAWCYLLVEKHKPLREVARERLKALEEMNHLGAGFAISMKDLEIRGAGNILGPQQSGHIAAIGYDMYCRLLKQTVERLEAGGEIEVEELVAEQEASGVELELGLRAFLPDNWIPDAKVRIEILRQLSAIRDDADAESAAGMLKDRFGRVPPEAEALLRTFRLKARLEVCGVRRLSHRDGVYVVEYRDRVALERGLDLATVDFRPLRTGVAHLPIPARHATPEQALTWFETLLRGARPQTKIARPSEPRMSLCALLLALTALQTPTEKAAPKPETEWLDLDRVVAIVNQDIITIRQFDRMVRREMEARNLKNPSERAAAQDRILRRHVETLLSKQAGQDMGADVEAVERNVQDSLERIIEGNNGVVGMSKLMSKEELNTQDVKKELREKLYSRAYVSSVTGEGTGVAERPNRDRFVRPGELKFHYQRALREPELLGSIGGSTESVTLQTLTLDTEKNGGRDATVALAGEMKKSIETGAEDMNDLVRRHSMGKTNDGVQPPVEIARLRRLDAPLAKFYDERPQHPELWPTYVSEPTVIKSGQLVGVRLVRIREIKPGTTPQLDSLQTQTQITNHARDSLDEYRLDRAFAELYGAAYIWPSEQATPQRH